MKGLILKNAFYDAPVYAHQCARIKEELEKLGIDVRCDGDRFLCDAAERAGVTFEQFVAALERSE